MAKVRDLVADQFGQAIGKHSRRLMLRQEGVVVLQAPLMHLQTVTVVGRGITISTDALLACCEQNIPILFTERSGEVYASIYAAGLVGTVQTRREQLAAYLDGRGLELARGVVSTKLRWQASLLRYLARGRRDDPALAESLQLSAEQIEDQQGRLRDLPPTLTLDQARGSIMGHEGAAGSVYWAALKRVIPAEYGFVARVGRGAQDPVNSIFNYGYGILYGEVEKALMAAGLDLYAGYLHADRAGKPSMVLDLTEEFRQVVVDRVLVGLLTRHFQIQQDADGRLTVETRRRISGAISHHLVASKQHGRKHISDRAKQIAVWLRSTSQHAAPLIGDHPVGDPEQN